MARQETVIPPIMESSDFFIGLSFVDYLEGLWEHLGLPSLTMEQRWIASLLDENSPYIDEMNNVTYASDYSRKLIILAFRGIAKTWITSAYVTWKLAKYPKRTFLIVSASMVHARTIVFFIRNLMETYEPLQWLVPDPAERNLAWGAERLYTRQSRGLNPAPNVRATGAGGQITGGRAYEVIFDDLEVPKNSDTQDKRESLVNVFREACSVILPDIEGAESEDEQPRHIMLGTPQSFNSIYTNQMASIFKVVRIPAQVPVNIEDDIQLYPMIRDLYTTGRLSIGDAITFRFPISYLLDKVAEIGASTYQLQFMLDTSLSDAIKYPLKLKDLIIFDQMSHKNAPVDMSWTTSPEYRCTDLPNVGLNGDKLFSPMMISDICHEYTAIKCYIDPSGHGKDRTGVSIGGILGNRIYLLEHLSITGGYEDDSIDKIIDSLVEYNCNSVYIEDNWGGGMYSKLFRARANIRIEALGNQWNCHIESVHSAGQKELRIISILEPIMNQHKLVINRHIAERDTRLLDGSEYSLFYQLSHITRERNCLAHDDSIDSLAGLCSTFTESMAANAKKMAEQYATDKANREIAEYQRLLNSKDTLARVLWKLGDEWIPSRSKPYDIKRGLVK